MPSKETKILEFHQYQKSNKTSFIIYFILNVRQKKTDGCKDNSENSVTKKVCEHILSGFLMFTT